MSILTVLEPAASSDLTVLATVKIDLGITGSSQDAKLSRDITDASAVIEAQCNRKFGKEKLSEQFRLTSNQCYLVLTRHPVVSIVSATENDSELTADDYECDLEKGILYRLPMTSLWCSGKITVVYFAGYELLDGVPYDIELACRKLIAHYRANAGKDPSLKGQQVDIPGVRSVRNDYWVGSIGENDALPPEVADLIAPYRNIVVG